MRLTRVGFPFLAIEGQAHQFKRHLGDAVLLDLCSSVLCKSI